MAKKNKNSSSGPRKPISFKSDTFESFGLLNDVDVEITGATYKPFNFNGTSRVRDTEIPNHVGVLEITYEVDGEPQKPDQLSYGGLDLYAPSADGQEPAGGDDDDYIALATGDTEEPSDDMEGPFLVPVLHDGKQKRGVLSDSTALAFFFRSLETCANAAGIELPDTDNIAEYLVGIKGHVNRLRNDRLGRNVPEGKGMVLVFTEMEEGPKTKKGKSKPAKDDDAPAPKKRGRPKKVKPEPEPEEEEDDDEEEEEEETPKKTGKKSSASDDDDDEFAESVKDAVLEILNSNGGSVKKLKLTKVTDSFKKKSDKEKALALVTEDFDDFVDQFDDEIEYDADTKMVSIA